MYTQMYMHIYTFIRRYRAIERQYNIFLLKFQIELHLQYYQSVCSYRSKHIANYETKTPFSYLEYIYYKIFFYLFLFIFIGYFDNLV